MSALGLAAVAAATGWDVFARWRGQPVFPKRMAALPAAAVAITGWQIFHSVHSVSAISHVNMAFLAAEGAAAVLLGLVRGPTVQLFEKKGYLAQRYRPASVLLWAILCVTGLALVAGAHAQGARLATGTNAVMLLLSLSDLAELALVLPRALFSPIPMAPAPDRHSRGGSALSRPAARSPGRRPSGPLDWPRPAGDSGRGRRRQW